MDDQREISQLNMSEPEKAALLRHAAYYQSWVQQSPYAVIIFDENNRILFWNAAATNLFGYQPDTVHEANLLNLIIPPQHWERYDHDLTRALKKGHTLLLGQPFFMTLRNKDGNQFTGEISFLQTQIEENCHFTAMVRKCGGSGLIEAEQYEIPVEVQSREKHLQEVGVLFTSIAENAPFPMWITDEHGNPIFLNRAWRDFIGPISNEPLNIDWSKLIPPDELITVQAEYYAALEQQVAYEGEFRMKRSDGQYRWIHCVANPRSGIKRAFIGSFVDITDRKIAEQALQEGKAYFNRLVNIVPAMICKVDCKGNATFYNQAWYDFTGRTFEEEKDMGWMDHIHPDDQEEVRASYLSAFRTQSIIRLEYRFRRHDAQYRWIFATGVPVYSNKGEFEGYIGSCVDITERKVAEHVLQESEARFRNLADASPSFVWMLDSQGQIVYLNKPLLEFLGKTFDEVLAEDWVMNVHPEDRNSAQDALVKALQEKRKIHAEFRVLRKDGEYCWWVTISAPRWDASGQYMGLVGSAMDITDRKHAERVLQESEERFRSLADAAPVSIGVYDEQGHAIYFNRATLDFLNVPMEAILGDKWQDYIYQEDRDQILTLHNKAILEQKEYTCEFRVYRADGMLRYLYRTAAPRFNSNGEYIGQICVSVDVTEQKVAIERFRRVYDSNIIGMAFWEQQGKVIQANDAFLKMLGFTQEDLDAGLINWLDLTPPEYADRDLKCLSQLRETGICSTYEKQYLHKDGHRVDVLMGAASMEDTPLEGVAFDLDITQRRKYERDLQWAMERERLQRQTLELTVKAADWAYEHKTGVDLHLVAEVIGQFYQVDRCLIVSFMNGLPEIKDATLGLIGQYCTNEFKTLTIDDLLEQFLIEYHQPLTSLYKIIAEEPSQMESMLKEKLRSLQFPEEVLNEKLHVLKSKLIEHLQIQSFIRVPIIYHDKAYGTVALHQCRSTRNWSQQEVDLLKDVAQHIGIAFYQAELQWQEHEAKQALEKSYNLIQIVNEAQGYFILKGEPYKIFERLLNNLLTYTESEFGFIGEVLFKADKTPYLRMKFISNIAWDEASQQLYDEYRRKGMEFHKLKSLYGKILTSGQIVISNDPMTDPRRGGIPTGHPPLKAFMGIPLYFGDDFIGVVGIANRPGGYDESLVNELQPYLTACVNLIVGVRNEELRKKLTRDLKASERSLKNYASKLERSNRDLDQFATIASHDLQAPLRKVILFSEFLKSSAGDQLPLECYDYIDRIQKAVSKMQVLIMDLLVLSRVNRRGKPFEPVDMANIIQEVLVDLEPLRQQVNGTIHVGSTMIIDADDIQMHQMLQNLVDNALKFHKPDVPPEVDIEVRPLNGQNCEVIVRDNGIGFDEKYLNRIFEVFERLHGESQFEGTGMGLAIVRKIAERHGGSVTAHSAPEQGATFVVTLPIHHS